MPDDSPTMAPNQPEVIPGSQYNGRTSEISKSESKQRLLIMGRLLASGRDDSEIEAIMEQRYSMDQNAVRRLRDRVYRQWAEEDSRRSPHLKSAARRRIYKHIEDAKDEKNFNAVANLEKILSGIEGTTVDPKNAITPTEQRIRESVVALLNEEDEKFIIEVIERERSFTIRKDDGGAEKQAVVIDTKPEDEEDSRCLPSRK